MPIIANKNVIHSTPATGYKQTFHTCILSKSLRSESERTIFIGRCHIYKKSSGDFPSLGLLWRYLIHLIGSHSLEHICSNVYMGALKFQIKTSKFFSKLKKVRNNVIFRHFTILPLQRPEGFLRMYLGFILCPEVCRV